jgi:hypothetical protein
MASDDKPLHAPAFYPPRPVVNRPRKKRAPKKQTNPVVAQPPADEAPPSSDDTKDVS